MFVFKNAPNCDCNFISLESGPSTWPSNRTRSLLTTGDYSPRTQELLGRNLLPRASQWLDSRLTQESSQHPELWHKTSRQLFCLDIQERPLWVASQLADLKLQPPHGLGDSPGAGRDASELQGKVLDPLFSFDQHGTILPMETYKFMLLVCTTRKDVFKAKQVYEHLVKHGLESSRSLGESVVEMFVKCGELEDAVKVFEKLQHRTSSSWTALILGYTEAGRNWEALRMYEDMREAGVHPDKYTFISLLKACGCIPDLAAGKLIHADAMKFSCDTHFIIGTCLVNMYAKCGSIVDAQVVFDRLHKRDIVSWTAMLAAYVQQDKPEEALRVYEQLQEDGLAPTALTFVPALQACAKLAEKEKDSSMHGRTLSLKCLQTGKAIHAEASKSSCGLDGFVQSALVSMYGKCHSIADARIVFDQILHPGLVSWTAMLGAFVQNGPPRKALEFYMEMVQEGVSPDAQSFVIAVQACCSMANEEEIVYVNGEPIRASSLQLGREVHVEVQRKGFESNVFVGSTLVGMYGNCGCIVAAKEVYDGLPKQNVVSWNVMLLAYVHQGQEERALELYGQMQQQNGSPDARTFVNVLQACSALADREDFVVVDEHRIRVACLQKGKAIHAEALSRSCELHVFVGNALVSVYGKCGCWMDAYSLFEGLSQRDVVTWNAMLSAFNQQNQENKALQLYDRMVSEGVTPDDTTFTSVLHACGNIGALDCCSQVHDHLVTTKTGSSPVVASALIHAYGKCARMESAQEVFDSQPNPDVVLWTSLMAGYARQGNFQRTLQCYEQMRLADVKPSGVTSLCLLSSCSHGGLIDLGVEYLESMVMDFGIALEVEHYTSVVDLLGRAGQFTLAVELLVKMPTRPDLSMWMCLLASCRKYGNVVLGRRAFDCAVHIQPTDPAAYVLMSNLYIQAGMWDYAREVNELRQIANAWKRPGQSWVGHQGGAESFMVGDSSDLVHEETQELLMMLSNRVHLV